MSDNKEVALVPNYSREQIDLIKKTVARGTTDEELQLFLYTAKRLGLDPLARQIHAVKRGQGQGATMSIQTGIDGYRLVAERTLKYAPGKKPEFTYYEDKKLESATAFVMKQTVDGKWHEVSATAYYDEYVQVKYDGTPNSMWKKMPRAMLSKCAEALALRKAFPAEFSGVYTHEEMAQADPEAQVRNPGDESTEVVEAEHSEAPALPESDHGELTFIPADVKTFSGKARKTGKPYTRYGVVHPDGRIFGTLDGEFGKMAQEAHQKKISLGIAWAKDGIYLNIKDAFVGVGEPDQQDAEIVEGEETFA